MQEEASFSVSDLVFEVPPKLDPKKFDLDDYEPFIDLLCGPREFQAEAIRICIRFLAGGEFGSTASLAEYNFSRNVHLEARYESVENLLAALPFPEKLACSVDLATGTGKSYVIYGIARILLNEGVVDRVLTLCPSTTIEAGLLEKFHGLSAEKDLREALPKRKGVRNPEIIQASSTLGSGTICVENIHATYAQTKSAISESLEGKGGMTLVLNDEAHHIYSPGRDNYLKKWKAFLENESYGFSRLVGFSGTCYIGNDYFPDVVYRYSLAKAIEEGTTKKIYYVDEDQTNTENEAFQKIRANHEKNRATYKPLKPLTILVTKDIKAARDLANRLTGFLKKGSNDKDKSQGVADQVLVVTSAKEHAPNVAKLRMVDRKSSPVEWIVSVSMLTEGWDVKNVFQIVPHERRAFNSKLLIAQVLGRGLRIPEGLAGTQPYVTVFNHERWAAAIRHLVEEVLELDVRLSAYSVPERDQFVFEIDQLVYRVAKRLDHISPAKQAVSIPSSISLAPQAKVAKRITVYVPVMGADRREEAVDVTYPLRPVTQVAERVRNRLKSIDIELGTDYARKAPQKKIEEIIRTSLSAVGASDDLVSEENEQRILAAFGPLVRRKTRQRPRLTLEVDEIVQISTRSMPAKSIGIGGLRKENALFYDEVSIESSGDHDRKLLAEIDDGHPYGGAVIKVPNSYNFKTCTSIVLTSHKPERLFVRDLLRSENAKAIDAWIKTPDVHFYGIEYTYRRGEHQKQATFNPDFFLSLNGGKDTLVVETKPDGDITDENEGKLKYAEQHFGLLNEKQSKRRYHFHFLSPKDYDLFFQAVRDRNYGAFRSELHSKLIQASHQGTSPIRATSAKTGSQ